MINVAVISAQSTTVVPNLSGLTASQALSALSAAELTVGSTSTTTSGASSANNGTVASQTVSSGSIVERYSSVGYTTYYYESAPPPPPPVTYNCQTWLMYSNSPGAVYSSQTNDSGSLCNSYSTNCVEAPATPPTPSQPTACSSGGGDTGGGNTGGGCTGTAGCENPFYPYANCVICYDACGNQTLNTC